MKKIFLLLFSMALAFSANAIDYDSYIVSITSISDQSSAYDGYCYQIDLSQKGLSRSDSKTYSTSACYYIHPKNHDIAGTFNASDGSLETDSYVKNGTSIRKSKASSSITITKNPDGTYTLSGVMYCTTGHTYFYSSDDSRNIFSFSPYDSEGVKKDIEFVTDEITAQDNTKSGYISLFLNNSDSEYIELAIRASEYALAAGDYTVSTSNAANTIIASEGGMMDFTPVPSAAQLHEGYETLSYYITGGSVNISYPDNKTIKVTGTVTSYKGSEITFDATYANPFYVPEPETYVLDVSSVAYVTDLYDDSFFQLSIGATNNGKTCNGFIFINSSTVPGDYDDDDIRNSSYFDNYMNSIKEDAENYVSIVATGNKEGNMAEYKLNLRLRMYDNNIYVVKDALFSVEEVVEPTPFDDEPEAGDPFTFELNIDAEPYCESENGTTVLRFSNSKYDKLVIAFPVSSMDKVVAGTYTIDSSNEEGTVIASPGILNWEYLPTVVEYGQGFFDSTPYFLTSGTVNVAYRDGKIFITGNVKSSKGSEITLNVSGLSPLEEEELPDNAFSGYLLGTGMNYFLAYDVTTNSNHTVTVSATLVLDEAVLALQPQVVIGTDTFDMSYDDTTGACEFTTTASYSKGNEIEISFNLHRSNTNVATDSFKYTVE